MGAVALPTMPFRAASTLTFFYALGYPIGALAVSAMSPMAVLVFRFGLAGAILSTWALAAGVTWPTGRLLAHVLFSGLLSQGLMYSTFYVALMHGAPAVLGAVIVSMSCHYLIVPDEIIDRRKGYFPVPAIRHLEGPFLDRVRDAVTDPVAKARGLVRRDWLDAMVADPNTKRTNLGSNALWQVALLEMWLQERGL